MAPLCSNTLWAWGLVVTGILLWLALRQLSLRPHLAVAVLVFAAGLVWTQAWLTPFAPTQGSYAISGRVFGEPTIRTANRLTFLLGDVTLDGEAVPTKAYCTLYTYGDDPLPTLFDGAEVRLNGRVYHPQGKSGQHDFDFRLWMYQNRLSYGISSIRELRILNTPQTAPWYDVASRVRLLMRTALTRVMGEEARLAMAMLINDREGLAQDETLAFQKTGIAHVMSVSGLHVGIVGGLALWLLQKCGLRRSWQLPLMTLFLMAYCGLTGFSAASVRAAIMLLLSLSARFWRRRSDPLITLSAALVVVLLLNPLQLFSAGFVLSFSAMAGLLLFHPRLMELLGRGKRTAYLRRKKHRRLSSRKRALRRALAQPLELFSVSASAQLGVLLPTAIYFHQLPLYGILINLLIVPLTGLLIPLYFLTLVVAMVPYAGTAVGFLAKTLSAWLLHLVQLLATLPYAVIRVPSAPVVVLCSAVMCAVLLSRYFRAPKTVRWVALLLVCAVALGGAYGSRPPQLRYIQLSVGRADAALLMDGNKTFAVDTGEFGDAISGYLLAEGRNLDAVFLTHLHLDHAQGIVELLDAGISIGTVYLPAGATSQRLGSDSLAIVEKIEAAGVPIVELAAGDELRYNEIGFTVLWPRRESIRVQQDANDLPLVMRIDFGGYSVFSASDLTGRYERYAATPCDVLKVAHHGSGDSTAGAFLDFLAPQFALISCAPGDQVLPDPETLRRLEERHIPIYRTDLDGEITLTVADGQLQWSTYKERTSQ